MPGGQRTSDLAHLSIDCRGDGAAVLADQHERSANHGFLTAGAGTAGAQFPSDQNLGDVTHSQRYTFARRNHNVADVLKCLQAAAGAHHVALATTLNVAGATAGVVSLQRFSNIGQRKSEANQPGWVRLDMELLHQAADGIDTSYSQDVTELRPDHPVLQRPQVGGALQLSCQLLPFGGDVAAVSLPTGSSIPHHVAFTPWRVVDSPHVDFAKAGGDRPHARLST